MDSLSPISDASRWSKLPVDLLHLVFERLGFADFQRAKCVCSPWQSASKQSARNNKIPWLIMFPEKGKDYCLLFNPEEKEKTYRIQDLGVDFANSHCLTICGSWLFMQNSRCNFYIINLFTRERIDLPSVESQVGMIKIERTIDDTFLVKRTNECDTMYHIDIYLPILWIDEKTKSYVVIWLIGWGSLALFQSKNGDSFWKQIEIVQMTADMVYKDHKLYLYSLFPNVLRVLNFSGDIPQKIFETNINYNGFLAKGMLRSVNLESWEEEHLVVTVSGEILRVQSIKWFDSDVWSFSIYKFDSSNSEWEKLTSLGEEAILLDQGITILANAIEGVKKNSIYFSGIHNDKFSHWSEKDIINFNLDTQKVERPHENICSSIRLSDARWCFPNLKLKCVEAHEKPIARSESSNKRKCEKTLFQPETSQISAQEKSPSSQSHQTKAKI